MDDRKPPFDAIDGDASAEADLHAYADGRCSATRAAEVERRLAADPALRQRVEAWQRHDAQLRALLDPVLDEPLPERLRLRERRAMPPRWAVAAALGALAVAFGAGGGWWARGAFVPASAAGGELAGLAQRAAIAHAVYSRDARRPVEVAGDQEQALVTWLSRRLGADVRAPRLAALGYELVGGRLLPGERGPVAQFMYQDGAGQRLTLYVSRDLPRPDTAFRFAREGPVNVFYWVERGFGYALSGGVERAELLRVSQEVYRQLGEGRG